MESKVEAITPLCRCGRTARLTKARVFDGIVYRRYRCTSGHSFGTEQIHKPRARPDVRKKTTRGSKWWRKT